MPDPERLMKTIRRAAELFRATPGRRGMVVYLDDSAEDALIAGDLHGNIAHFQAILDRARLDRHPRRHLVLQEVVHGMRRYPNGGCKSHQLLDLVAALKCQYPDRVHLILGNHEIGELTAKSILKAGVRTNEQFRLGVQSAYGEHAERVYESYHELLRSLPLAVRTANRVFMCHSAPEAAYLREKFDVSIFEAESIAALDTTRGSSVYALVWGRDTSAEAAAEFAKRVDADLLVTGHLACPEGYAVPNPTRLVLDCNCFPACYCIAPARRPVSQQDLVAAVQTL
jgi:hypothetical protein